MHWLLAAQNKKSCKVTQSYANFTQSCSKLRKSHAKLMQSHTKSHKNIAQVKQLVFSECAAIRKIVIFAWVLLGCNWARLEVPWGTPYNNYKLDKESKR